jgi:CBS domain containing-hemolysin-like protein
MTMSSGFVDAAAHVIAIVVIILVPIVGISVFWLVHILPEKIAEKRHHPQKDAIKTLCLLSLVFGGLLWPIAWLWAYTKPVLHKMAYGTDKGEHHDDEALGPVAVTKAGPVGLHDRLARLEQRGIADTELNALRQDIEAIEARMTATGTR